MEIQSTQVCISLKSLFSRHKGIGVQFTDEPTGALDYNTGKQILQLLQDTCRKEKITVLIITHNSALAPMADRLIQFKSGTVISESHNEHPVPISEIEW